MFCKLAFHWLTIYRSWPPIGRFADMFCKLAFHWLTIYIWHLASWWSLLLTCFVSLLFISWPYFAAGLLLDAFADMFCKLAFPWLTMHSSWPPIGCFCWHALGWKGRPPEAAWKCVERELVEEAEEEEDAVGAHRRMRPITVTSDQIGWSRWQIIIINTFIDSVYSSTVNKDSLLRYWLPTKGKTNLLQTLYRVHIVISGNFNKICYKLFFVLNWLNLLNLTLFIQIKST